jgi:hypothetical protein
MFYRKEDFKKQFLTIPNEIEKLGTINRVNQQLINLYSL